MKESFGEKVFRILGALSPLDPVQTLSLIQDVISEKVMGQYVKFIYLQPHQITKQSGSVSTGIGGSVWPEYAAKVTLAEVMDVWYALMLPAK